jgi:hypothetical protein
MYVAEPLPYDAVIDNVQSPINPVRGSTSCKKPRARSTNWSRVIRSWVEIRLVNPYD